MMFELMDIKYFFIRPSVRHCMYAWADLVDFTKPQITLNARNPVQHLEVRMLSTIQFNLNLTDGFVLSICHSVPVANWNMWSYFPSTKCIFILRTFYILRMKCFKHAAWYDRRCRTMNSCSKYRHAVKIRYNSGFVIWQNKNWPVVFDHNS